MLCGLCKKKDRTEEKDHTEALQRLGNKNEYQRVRELCIEKEVEDIHHAVKKEIMRRYSLNRQATIKNVDALN